MKGCRSWGMFLANDATSSEPDCARCAHWVEESHYSCSDPGAGISERALGNHPGHLGLTSPRDHDGPSTTSSAPCYWTSFLAVNRHLPQRVSPCLFCYLPCRSMRVLNPEQCVGSTCSDFAYSNPRSSYTSSSPSAVNGVNYRTEARCSIDS